MKPRNHVPSYPDFIKVVRRKGKVYEYFDTGRKTIAGKTIRKPMPDKSDRSYGGTYASLLAARVSLQNVKDAITIHDLSRAYQKSPSFKKRSESTQSTYLIYLRHIEDQMQDADVSDITRGDVRKLLDGMQDRPGAANMTLLVMRGLARYALARDWMATDPTNGVEAFETDENEHEPWPEDLIALALADPDVRLPVALLYFTAQRIGDVCKMRWNDIRDGYLYVKQQKTKRELDIRLHEDLAALLAATPRDSLTIIHGPKMRPARPATLRGHLQAWARLHGHEIVPHGLRKNAVNALLEAGCSTAETSSISGQSLAMVEHYAKRRNNRRIGSAAILKWQGTKRGNRNNVEND
jgi:integrase